MAKKKSGGFFANLGDMLEEGLKGLSQETPAEPAGGKPEPITRRVSLIVHNPRVLVAWNQRLNNVLG